MFFFINDNQVFGGHTAWISCHELLLFCHIKEVVVTDWNDIWHLSSATVTPVSTEKLQCCLSVLCESWLLVRVTVGLP